MDKFILKNGLVIDPLEGIHDKADIYVENGKVIKIAERITKRGVKQIDLDGLVVAPGFIDIHVHLREPGYEYKEDIESGLKAAIAGGFTTICCMPNTKPVNDNPYITEYIISRANKLKLAKVYPIGAITVRQEGKILTPMAQLKRAGVIAFSDDGFSVENSDLLLRAFQYSNHFNTVIIQHPEDNYLSNGGVMNEGEVSARLGMRGIPNIAEDVIIARDIMLADYAGSRYHVAHLSTKKGLELVKEAKKSNIKVTCEVTPHHLLLTDRSIEEYNFSTCVKMKPPLRTEKDRKALIEGLKDGTVDVIASDHAPHHKDEKELPFEDAPFGIVGLETTVSVLLDRLVREGIISLERLIELLSTNPAKILSLPGGTLKEGSVADITVIDPQREHTIDPKKFYSKGRSTPFAGWRVKGKVVMTIIEGRIVYADL